MTHSLYGDHSHLNKQTMGDHYMVDINYVHSFTFSFFMGVANVDLN